jgi:alpha-beta hydrolase superfamily lysophospholipase
VRSSTWPRHRWSRRGCRVVALDAPGFGRSRAVETDAYALDRLAGLFRAAAHALSIAEALLAGPLVGWRGRGSGRPYDHTAARALVVLDGGHTDPGNWPDA